MRIQKGAVLLCVAPFNLASKDHWSSLSQGKYDPRFGAGFNEFMVLREILGQQRMVTEPVGQLARNQQMRASRLEEHTSELQSQSNLVCRLLLEKKKKKKKEQKQQI